MQATKVFGYKLDGKEKQVVEATLLIDTVVTHDIFPLRIDLCDLDAAELPVEGENLRFSRLSKIAFALSSTVRDTRLRLGRTSRQTFFGQTGNLPSTSSAPQKRTRP
jgi:hypothetical protein